MSNYPAWMAHLAIALESAILFALGTAAIATYMLTGSFEGVLMAVAVTHAIAAWVWLVGGSLMYLIAMRGG